MTNRQELLLTALIDALETREDLFGLDADGSLRYRDEWIDNEIVSLLCASNANLMADIYSRIVQAGQEKLKMLEPRLHPNKVAGLKHMGTMLPA